jgi:hypothetical protein
MSEKRVWTRQELVDPLVGDFDTSPFPITLGVDGNELLQSEFKDLTPEQRLDSLYTTMAVNHARKSLGLDSLYQLRINKNPEVINLTAEGGKFVYDNTPQPRILLVVGKSYTINTPSPHPIALAEELDDNGQGFVEYTAEGITRVTPNQIKVTPTVRTPNLYYYCTAHANMGGEIGATNAYTFETVQVEGSDGLVDDYFIRWDPSQFNRLSVEEVAIDLAALTLDSDSQVRQTYLSFIPQIDTTTNNSFDASVNVQNFKDSIANDMVFLDQEDYLDLSGNTLLMKWTNTEEPIIQNEYSDALAMNSGPGHKPYTDNLTTEQAAQIDTGINRYKEIISEGKLPASSYFNPPRKQANDNPSAFEVVETAPIAARSYLHQCYELCNWNEIYQPADGIFFDSIFLFLNIKDPAYGISADGSGCQDYMEPRQKVRIARVLTEKGIFSKRRNVEFTMEDQPRGSLFMGDCVVSVPTAYVSPRYDIFPRFDMFCYGENNHKFENNPNLKYRVKHDLEQKDGNISLTEEQLQEMSDNAVWSAVQDLPSAFSQDHFKLRGTDGITKISVFKRGVNINTSNVGYKSATFSAGTAQQTYWVLDPALTLNLDLFNHGVKRMFILDETGYDLNSSAQSFENLYSYKV